MSEFIDSREAFDESEETAYHEDTLLHEEKDREEFDEYCAEYWARERDEILAQQELEDFEQADEYYGYYGQDEPYYDEY